MPLADASVTEWRVVDTGVHIQPESGMPLADASVTEWRYAGWGDKGALLRDATR